MPAGLHQAGVNPENLSMRLFRIRSASSPHTVSIVPKGNGEPEMIEVLTLMTALFVALFGGLTLAALRNGMQDMQAVQTNEKARR
jgi:putative effector of murein hydrolase